MQRVTWQAAFEPETWTRDRAEKVAALFDSMAPTWNARQQYVNRYDALLDALARGNANRGRCLEVGSGTGLVTPMLADVFPSVISVDLSAEMLAVAPTGVLVQADAASLPFRAGSFACIVLVNALLFPAEVDRVLADGGTVVWVSTRGTETPIYLAPDDVPAALPGGWRGVASEAGPGTWAVVARA